MNNKVLEAAKSNREELSRIKDQIVIIDEIEEDLTNNKPNPKINILFGPNHNHGLSGKYVDRIFIKAFVALVKSDLNSRVKELQENFEAM